MKYLIFLVASLTFISCKKEAVVQSQGCIIQNPVDVYNYPVKPGTTAWNDIHTPEERLNASQVPTSVLKSITTEGLIVTAFTNPSFFDIYLGNSKQQSFDYLYSIIPCFKELVNRPDAAEKLMERYMLMNPICKQNNWPSLNGQGSNSGFSFASIEFIIAQYKILQQIEDSGKTFEVGKLVLKRQNEKLAIGLSDETALSDGYLILARMMYKASYQPLLDEYYNANDDVINVFINHGMNFGMRVIPKIHKLATDFLK